MYTFTIMNMKLSPNISLLYSASQASKGKAITHYYPSLLSPSQNVKFRDAMRLGMGNSLLFLCFLRGCSMTGYH